VPLFELAATQKQPTIDVAPFHEWFLPDGTRWLCFYRRGLNYVLRFPDLADFEVTADGRGVRCWPAPGVTKDTVEHLYLNQVLPRALSRRGQLIFHASAVEAKGGAVAFMGRSGWGKSTLAASFAANGFRFLTDDQLVVEAGEGGYRALPSHRSIRLWEDSREVLVGEGTRPASPVQFTSKLRFLADDTMVFCAEPKPLHFVYFLGEGAAREVTFVEMSASEALIELVKHSFLLDIEARDLIASHFERLAHLVCLPNYYRLDYPRRFEMLGELRQAILSHCDRCAHSAFDHGVSG
jgi:hypothetical protein